MEKEKAPLSDLSFFRFPELTPEVMRNILLLVVLLALTVLITVAGQRWLQTWNRRRRQRRALGRIASAQHMPPATREVLTRLMHEAGADDAFSLVHDAEGYEAAVERLAAEADEETLEHLARLRRMFHLNVMNPEQALISTRQLLADLPVRLLADIGVEKLDVYCAVLGTDERHLLLDLPRNEEILHLLRAHPQVLLVHWREPEGETVFRITLEPIGEGAFPAFRARHVHRDAEAANRSAFRLSVDLPVSYQFLERSELARLRGARGGGRRLSEGEGRLIDLSYGGASFVAPEPLGDRGFAQLRFQLHAQPLSLMLEVLSRAPLGEGGFLVRGQFRGLGEEARVKLNGILSREQIKRLREKELLHIRPEL
jgi:uncharacterized protein YjiS (DUF1127 family)